MSQIRVWGRTDPRFLNRKHLLAEHREIHVLNHVKNGPGPEFSRFWDTDRGKSALLLRHELVRVAMNERWPRHTRSQHKTPVLFRYMLPPDKQFLVQFAQFCKVERDTHRDRAVSVQARFTRRIHKLKFPPCDLEDGAETPWERDGIPFLEYLRVGDNWERSRYHHKHRQWKDGRRT